VKRLLPITALLLGTIQAEELTTQEVAQTLNYRHSALGEKRHQRTLKRLAKISTTQAAQISQEQCQSEIRQSRLIRHGNRLYYHINTSTCYLRLDALDGTIINKESRL